MGTVSGASRTVNPGGEEAAAALRGCYEVWFQSSHGKCWVLIFHMKTENMSSAVYFLHDAFMFSGLFNSPKT